MEKNIENNVISEEKRNFIQDFINLIKSKLNKEQTLIIDRFENEFAVCEDFETGKIINIEKLKLPEESQEGNVLKFKDNKYTIDIQETMKRKQNIEDKMRNLFE